MWIFCCGAKRSGSTLQYNIAARIVELTDTGIRIEHHKPEEFGDLKEQLIHEKKYKVFKSHVLTEEIENEIRSGNAKSLYCFRDIRDVVVSYLNKKWINRNKKEIEKLVENYIVEYDKWMELKEHLFIRKYENFYNNITDEVKAISKYLNIEVEDTIINKIVNELNSDSLKSHIRSEEFNFTSQGKFVFDKNTLLHENHIQGVVPHQFEDKLNKNEIVNIEAIAYSWLKQNGYDLLWHIGDLFLSFSQHGDDYIAWQLLGKKKKGMIVEVGAFDGVHLSNSYSLEQIGWQSICVEPNPIIYPYLKKNRPDAIKFNCAVVGNSSIDEVSFFVERTGVLSGIEYDETDLVARYQKRGISYEKPNEVKVNAKTLNDIFSENNLGFDEVDIVSIDVEGYEIEVLSGLDFNKYCPKLFIIEANSDNEKKEIISFFEKNNLSYLYLGNNNQNLFFQLKHTFKKNRYKHLNLENYIFAKQKHPIDESLSIQSKNSKFSYNPQVGSKRGIISKLFYRK